MFRYVMSFLPSDEGTGRLVYCLQVTQLVGIRADIETRQSVLSPSDTKTEPGEQEELISRSWSTSHSPNRGLAFIPTMMAMPSSLSL